MTPEYYSNIYKQMPAVYGRLGKQSPFICVASELMHQIITGQSDDADT
jgi:hypothetical protein